MGVANSFSHPHSIRWLLKEFEPEKKGNKVARLKNLCHIVPDYRTFIEDYLKIVEFIEWLKDFYPQKATFLMEKS